MKNIYLILTLLALAACNSSNPSNGETLQEQSDEPIHEDVQVANPEASKKEMLLGTWEFTDPKIKVTQVITYKEDGTYQLQMASMNIEGTWELNDNLLVTKSRPDAPGQKKEILKLDSENLWVLWGREGAEAKELRYVRKQ